MLRRNIWAAGVSLDQIRDHAGRLAARFPYDPDIQELAALVGRATSILVRSW